MLIGLSGKARVGKDTVAAYLKAHHGFKPIALADKLKEVCEVLFDLSWDQLYGNLKDVVDEFWGVTPRHILQTVGMAMRKGYGEDIWIRACERRMRLRGIDNDWVITDLRLPNEVEWCKGLGGQLSRVSRPNAPAIATAQHISETALDDFREWDYVLENNSDLPQLYANIEVMIQNLHALKSVAVLQEKLGMRKSKGVV